MPIWRDGVPVYPTWTDWTKALLGLPRGQRKTPGNNLKLRRNQEPTRGLSKTLQSRKFPRLHTRRTAEMWAHTLASGGLK